MMYFVQSSGVFEVEISCWKCGARIKPDRSLTKHGRLLWACRRRDEDKVMCGFTYTGTFAKARLLQRCTMFERWLVVGEVFPLKMNAGGGRTYADVAYSHLRRYMVNNPAKVELLEREYFAVVL